ncbi:MAG TPA: geranylgeranylglycerol-phosphate geranylgeranyltransferase [Chitinophagaceae bacterium]
MRLIGAFLKMVRLPNLIFIALTQILFHQCIIHRVLEQVGSRPLIDGWIFIALVTASVLIAGAGYIINDYFDINIDEVNKPNKNVVDHIVSRRWAMLWHFVLSGAGILISLYISWKTGLWYIVLANVLCVLLLFGYSVSLKKKFLWGNLVISLLTAWVILILCFSETGYLFHGVSDQRLLDAHIKITRLGLLYAGFAFISSLVREAIKDMEDMIGDARYGCRTMPIVWGVNATKVYTAVWLVVLIALLILVQVYVLQFRWWMPVAYSIVLIILPLIYILYHLYRANSAAQFHHLSAMTKVVMFTGILSMIFFYFHL